MVSVCLPSDALLHHLLSYLGFSSFGRGVSLHGCSSKVQPLLLTLDEGYLLTATLPDLQCGIAPLGPPAPAQSWLLGRGVGPPGHRPWPWSCSCSSPPPPLASGLVAWGSSSRPSPLASGLGHGVSPLIATPDLRRGVTPLVAAPDLRRGVALLGRSCAVAVWHSWLLPLTLDTG